MLLFLHHFDLQVKEIERMILTMSATKNLKPRNLNEKKPADNAGFKVYNI